MDSFSNITCPKEGGNFCIIVYIFLYFSKSTDGEPKDLKLVVKDLRSGEVIMFP